LLYHADTCDYSQNDVSWKDHVIRIGVPTKITSNGEDNVTLCLSTIWNDLRETQNFSHVMVEGGPTVAHAFLRQGLIDRVLLVQATQIRFQDPYPSYMNLEILKQYGLDLLGCVDRGDGDNVYCLSKANLPWPTKNLIDWP
jgi:riboflavin biosynthesis pyrimidine reductase